METALALLNSHGWLAYHSTKHGFVEEPSYPENTFLQQPIAHMSKCSFYYKKNCANRLYIWHWNLIILLLFIRFSLRRAVSAKIFVGTHDLYKVTGKHTIASSVFYEHPYYDPKEIKNDVALVELPKEIGFDGKIRCTISIYSTRS